MLRYDEGDSFNRSGVVTEAHAMVLDLLAAVFRIPGAAGRCLLECHSKQLLNACSCRDGRRLEMPWRAKV